MIIAVKSFEPRMKMMHLPRVLLTPNLLGRPLGSPGDSKTQRNIILTALKMLENTKNGGEILDFKTFVKVRTKNKHAKLVKILYTDEKMLLYFK